MRYHIHILFLETIAFLYKYGVYTMRSLALILPAEKLTRCPTQLCWRWRAHFVIVVCCGNDVCLSVPVFLTVASSCHAHGRISTSGHMAWERTLRTMAKIPSKKKGKSHTPIKKDTARRGILTAGKAKGKGGGDDGDEEEGRPSLGSWNEAQNMLQLLKELTGTVSLAATAYPSKCSGSLLVCRMACPNVGAHLTYGIALIRR